MLVHGPKLKWPICLHDTLRRLPSSFKSCPKKSLIARFFRRYRLSHGVWFDTGDRDPFSWATTKARSGGYPRGGWRGTLDLKEKSEPGCWSTELSPVLFRSRKGAAPAAVLSFVGDKETGAAARDLRWGHDSSGVAGGSVSFHSGSVSSDGDIWLSIWCKSEYFRFSFEDFSFTVLLILNFYECTHKKNCIHFCYPFDCCFIVVSIMTENVFSSAWPMHLDHF
jgi:hypothetical protein